MATAEFAGPGLTTWLVAGLSRGDRSIPSGPRSNPDDALERASAGVLFLDGCLEDACNRSLPALLQALPAQGPALMILVPHLPAPVTDSQYDGPVRSFLCSPGVFRELLKSRPERMEDFCFHLLQQVADGSIPVDHLTVRQLPYTHSGQSSAEPAWTAAVLVPHRGGPGHLRAALASLQRTNGGDLRVRAGLDVDDPEAYCALAEEFPSTEFFKAQPCPVGPYVIRQELAEHSTEPLLCLQDADDLSCSDRFSALYRGMISSGCDMIGSHQLCLDEVRRQVYPVRFPLDASAALGIRPNHAQLHATIMVRRDAFFAAGGLSTDQIVANDTQFLLRSFFSMRIRNADEFLYICRRHSASLTNAPETRWGNPLRTALDTQWSADFSAIQAGRMTLAGSSLRPVRRAANYSLEPIRS